MDGQRKNETRDVQDELERQLREFGDTMSEAARQLGRAAVDAANETIDRAAKSSGWSSFLGGNQPAPTDEIRRSAQKRWGTGLALMIVGGIFAFSFFTGGLAVLGSMPFVADAANTAIMSADMVDGVVIEMTATGGEFVADFGSAAYSAMGIVGGLLEATAAGFAYMMWAGWQRIKASRWLNRCADTVEGMDAAEGVSLGLLKETTSQKTHKVFNIVRKYIQKGWLPAWLDEQTGKIYLTAESYRAAQEAKRKPQPQPESEPASEPAKEHVNLETARRFAKVLESERVVMRDEQAAEELARMQKTTLAICDWLKGHPESMPKARRFAEYYIPTTLKLLHTYNDVQGQKGENAESIRRDIADILHTLNQAYDNLYNTLLSDMALDVSSEIAALQGMLANDGLTGEGKL